MDCPPEGNRYGLVWVVISCTYRKLVAMGGGIKAPKLLRSSGPEPVTTLHYVAKAN